jgi:hypothetical protein
MISEVARGILTRGSGFISGSQPLLCRRLDWRQRIEVTLMWCLSVKRWMWTLGIVEAQILSDAGADIGNVAVGVHVDHLIFYRSPQALGEDIVPPGAFAVHGDGDGCVLQHLDKVDERELAALVHCPAGYCEAMSREGVLKISGLPCRPVLRSRPQCRSPFPG